MKTVTLASGRVVPMSKSITLKCSQMACVVMLMSTKRSTMPKVRSILTSIVVIATSIFATGLPAQATPAPSLTIANTGTSLVGSSVNNFDPTTILDLILTSDAGHLRIALGDSGAVAASGYGLSGSTIGISGTQDQLNAALGSAYVLKGCDPVRNITGTVVPANGYKYNAANGHWYAEVNGQTSGGSARDAAKAKTIPLGIGNGYLANITSAQENDFIKNNFGSSPQIGGSDAAKEGDWYWMDGPEAGTKFYSNGAVVANAFANFGANEPNNLGIENYLQTGGGNWNDNTYFQSYLVEFGGMPGDDFSAIQMANQTAAITVPALSGLGTSVSPNLVSNQSDFEAVAECGSSKYMQQTADITTDDTFTGLTGFSGHFDGNGKTIDLSASTSMTGSLFGSVSGTSRVTDTTVSHLKVTGATVTSNNCSGSVFANSISYATIDDVEISGASISGECQLGLLAINVSNSVIKNTDVSGSLSYGGFVYGAGALAAWSYNSQFINDTCALQNSSSDSPYMRMFEGVGGCVGRSDQSSYSRVSSSGAMSIGGSGMFMMMMEMNQVGGLIGYCNSCTVTDSSSSVGIDVPTSPGMMMSTGFGGLIGMANSTTVNRSFVSGSISAPQSYSVGGLVGRIYLSTVSNSYSTGSVTGQSQVGSLVGNMQSSNVSNSYSTGAVVVEQSDSSHGLIGYSSNHEVTNSFWRINPTGVVSTTESVGQEAPKYSGELKKPSTFAGWNISSTPSSLNDWALCPDANGGYPYLAWQTVDSGCVRTFTPDAAVSVTGIAYVGGTVTATPASWDSQATLSYQWLDGVTPIPLATSATFTPALGDVGKQLSVKVTGAKDGYISSVITTAVGKIAAAPKTKLVVVGGFAKNAKVASKATKAAVKALLKNLGTVVSVQCDAFATGKKLTAAQKVVANARAAAVCALITAAKPSPAVVLKNSVAKKTDKIKEGVRVTIISLLK